MLAISCDTSSARGFEILSIDIADVDVGENIGAKLQTDQAEADLKIARAKAEERRAAAVATEQENVADIQRQRARFVEAEADVPKAIAEAFRAGNLGILDYYNLKNVVADTDMVISLSSSNSIRLKVVLPAPDGDDSTSINPRREKSSVIFCPEESLMFYIIAYCLDLIRRQFSTFLLCADSVFAKTCPPVPSATKYR